MSKTQDIIRDFLLRKRVVSPLKSLQSKIFCQSCTEKPISMRHRLWWCNTRNQVWNMKAISLIENLAEDLFSLLRNQIRSLRGLRAPILPWTKSKNLEEMWQACPRQSGAFSTKLVTPSIRVPICLTTQTPWKISLRSLQMARTALGLPSRKATTLWHLLSKVKRSLASRSRQSTSRKFWWTAISWGQGARSWSTVWGYSILPWITTDSQTLH